MQILEKYSGTRPSLYQEAKIDRQGFKEFESVQRTLAGVEVVNIIRKDQIANSRKTTFKTFCSLAA